MTDSDESESGVYHIEDRNERSYYDVQVGGVTFSRVKVNSDGSIFVLLRDRREHGDDLADIAIETLRDHLKGDSYE